MTKGWTLPDDEELDFLGREHPETWAKLREIENRAFEKSGRIADLKREVGLAVDGEVQKKAAPAPKAAAKPDVDKATKQKIVSRLKEKAETGKAKAKEKVVARASARTAKAPPKTRR